MKLVAHTALLTALLVLALAVPAATVHAQDQGQSDQPAKPGGQAGDMQGQGSMGPMT
jgi:hypothetical protein